MRRPDSSLKLPSPEAELQSRELAAVTVRRAVDIGTVVVTVVMHVVVDVVVVNAAMKIERLPVENSVVIVIMRTTATRPPRQCKISERVMDVVITLRVTNCRQSSSKQGHDGMEFSFV
jgi:hypothetical protein